MKLHFETIRSVLMSGQRYRSPEVKRFWSNDGPYSIRHAYDSLLERDVEFCEEHLWLVQKDFERSLGLEGRERFIMEAKIGALGHPHIPPTFDFGTIPDSKVGERLYFTRPCVMSSLYREFCWPFECAALLELLELLDGQEEHWISEDYFETRRQAALRNLNDAISKRLVLETHRSKRLLGKQFTLPTEIDKSAIMKRLEAQIANAEGEAKQAGMSESALQERIQKEKRRAFDELLDTTLRLNNFKNLYDIGYQEQLVMLNLHKFIEPLLGASDAVDFAHEHDVLHLGLSPGAIRFGMDNDHVYVTGWHWAYVAGARWKPVYRSSHFGGERAFFPKADTNPEYYDLPECSGLSPKTDIFSLGGILSYLLHEPPRDEHDRGPRQLRSIYYSRGESNWLELRETLIQLENVSKRALEFNPTNRQQSAKQFAAEIQNALESGASGRGLPSLTNDRKDECNDDRPRAIDPKDEFPLLFENG